VRVQVTIYRNTWFINFPINIFIIIVI